MDGLPVTESGAKATLPNHGSATEEEETNPVKKPLETNRDSKATGSEEKADKTVLGESGDACHSEKRPPSDVHESEWEYEDDIEAGSEDLGTSLLFQNAHASRKETEEEALRRSGRVRKLTEKAQKNKEEETCNVFWRKFREFESGLKEVGLAAKGLDLDLKPEFRDDLLSDLKGKSDHMHRAYEEVRGMCVSSPPSEIRRGADQLTSRMKQLVSMFHTRSKKGDDNISLSSHGSKGTRSSSSVSSARRETAAKAAALRMGLEVQKEEDEKAEELQRLELEESKRRAQEEAAEKTRRAEAEAKLYKMRREIEHQKMVKELKMEEARLQVYDEDTDNPRPVMTPSEEPAPVTRPKNLKQSQVPSQKPKYLTSEDDVLKFRQAKLKGVELSIQEPFSYAPPNSKDRSKTTLRPEATVWEPAPKSDIAIIAETLAASVNLGRLPVPEPAVFSGDALQFPDWMASFTALIENRGVPPHERIHYLKRYLGGPAREAVGGCFLLRSDRAYEKAKAILEDRYGSHFAVSEAFRNKLDSWPKIAPRDSRGLRQLSDFLQQCVIAMNDIYGLDILNDTRENRKLLQKLPDWLVTRWSRMVVRSKRASGIYPSFAQFADFILEEAEIACDPVTSLNSLKTMTIEKEADRTAPKKRNFGAKVLSTSSQELKKNNTQPVKQFNSRCNFCSRSGHIIQECRTFAGKPLSERNEFIKNGAYCYGCLKQGHVSKECPKRSVCKSCSLRHPTSLHEDRRGSPFQKATESENKKVNKPNPEPKEAICRSVSGCESGSMTSMVVPVWISSEANPDQEHLTYALLDTQSDTTFVLTQTSELVYPTRETLFNNSTAVELKLTTMTAEEKSVRCRKFHGLLVRGYEETTRIPLKLAYTRDYIPVERSHIPTPETARRCPHLEGIADRLQPLLDCEVGLLIGYDCPQALAPRNCIVGNGNEPFAVETDLGWSVVGGEDPRMDSGDSIGLTCHTVTTRVPKRLQIETEGINAPKEVKYVLKTAVKETALKPPDVVKILESDFSERNTQEKMMSQEDLRFLRIVKEGIKQQEDGHFSMPLPFKREKPNLPDNKPMAAARLEHLLRRFKRDPRYYADYKTFMEDIISKGEAEKVPDNQREGGVRWYIPHHGVYHPKKPDKIRVVFDCGAKFRGTCLNDHLLQGPDQLNTLIGVLCRFRQEKIAIMCDIERMFHRFYVESEHHDYLRFLWWENGQLNTKPVEYRMKVHLFGAVSSPGCAIYGLKHIATKYQHLGPDASSFIAENFYMDDGLVSVPEVDEAIQLIQEARTICDQGKLRLHKFASNSREAIESVPQSERAKEIMNLDLSLDDLPIERALGIQWSIESDVFQFRLTLQDQPLTRRGILSMVSSVFDPLGFLAPFILQGKQILQLLCKEGTDWDHPLPEELRPRWERWRQDLRKLSKIQIPRCYRPQEFGETKLIEIHHFSDASMSGYGQCSYLRLVDYSDKVHCSLVMAKARVTPLKPITIPRLELQAAVVSVKISDLINRELSNPSIKNYFWTDSKVVLGYINNEARRFHIYVANRVQRIQDSSSPEQWRYVSTKDNPADFASRGLTAEDLSLSSWFKGPAFLWRDKLPTETTLEKTINLADPEVRKATVMTTRSVEKTSMLERFNRFSDWSRLLSAVTMLLNCVLKKLGKAQLSRLESRKKAEHFLIQTIQKEAFMDEIKELRQGKDTNRRSRLHRLDPFLDREGTLRVGGRLKNSTLHFSIKHPAIIPKKTHISELIIRYYHQKVAHQGRGMTTNALRSNGYWILGCSSQVSSFIFKCIVCRRYRGASQTQKMADLPAERLECSPPFLYSGVDCFGPFYVKDRQKELKRYGLLFTCMASRAIHVELLDDMTTDAFINGLRCFIAIRGQVQRVRCDQGTNFVGAREELKAAMKEIDTQKVNTFFHNQLEFVMNVPGSSHMGGVWERQIRTIRSVLTILLGQFPSRLDSSSLRTLFYEVMAIVNSRPLTVETLNDPQDALPLTPNHLLTLKSGIVMPPPGDFVKEDVYARKRWRRVQYLANEFWRRWKKEYLSTLQPRQKWHKEERNIQVGDIVLLHETDSPRCDWKLARVDATNQGKDGLVRTVKLLMSNTDLTKEGKRTGKARLLERPIHKLTVLVESPKA